MRKISNAVAPRGTYFKDRHVCERIERKKNLKRRIEEEEEAQEKIAHIISIRVDINLGGTSNK